MLSPPHLTSEKAGRTSHGSLRQRSCVVFAGAFLGRAPRASATMWTWLSIFLEWPLVMRI